MSTLMTSEDGVEAERRRKVGTHAQWRVSGAALNVARHRDVGIRSCRPLCSPGAELSGLAHGAARLDVMTCSGFAHIHMRASVRCILMIYLEPYI